jgi:hypothetical protein
MCGHMVDEPAHIGPAPARRRPFRPASKQLSFLGMTGPCSHHGPCLHGRMQGWRVRAAAAGPATSYRVGELVPASISGRHHIYDDDDYKFIVDYRIIPGYLNQRLEAASKVTSERRRTLFKAREARSLLTTRDRYRSSIRINRRARPIPPSAFRAVGSRTRLGKMRI